MALSEPVLSGPGAGRTVTYGDGSSAELKLAGEQSGGDWAVVEWRVRAGDERQPEKRGRWREARRSRVRSLAWRVGRRTSCRRLLPSSKQRSRPSPHVRAAHCRSSEAPW